MASVAAQQLARKAQGLDTGVHYPIALPKLEAYAYLGQQNEPTFANRSDRTLLSLPIGDHMTTTDVATVVAAVRDWVSAGRALRASVTAG